MNKNLMTMILTRIKPDRILYSLQAVKLQEPILIIPDEGSWPALVLHATLDYHLYEMRAMFQTDPDFRAPLCGVA